MDVPVTHSQDFRIGDVSIPWASCPRKIRSFQLVFISMTLSLNGTKKSQGTFHGASRELSRLGGEVQKLAPYPGPANTISIAGRALKSKLYFKHHASQLDSSTFFLVILLFIANQPIQAIYKQLQWSLSVHLNTGWPSEL